MAGPGEGGKDMKRNNLVFLIAAVLMSALLGPIPESRGQEYPSKSIELIVPYNPGGRSDLVGRIVAERLEQVLKQKVIVVNKAGAGGVLGAKYVAQAKPDGYTIGFFSNGVVTSQYTVATPTNLKEYDPVAMVNQDPAALAVANKTGWKNAPDMVQHAQKNPGVVMMGVTPGASSHLFAAFFANSANIKVKYVPFKGGMEKDVAVAGGHVDACMDAVGPFKPLADAGKLRILGITGAERNPLYREIPTLKEQGLDCVIGSWQGIFAPRGLPPAALEVLDRAAAQMVQDEGFKERMGKVQMGIKHLNRSEFLKFLEKDDVIQRELVQAIGLTPGKKK